MAESDQVKAALAALADGEVASDDDGGATRVVARDDSSANRTATGDTGGDADYRTVIEQATEATSELDAAVAFLEEVGVGRLEAAVEQAEREVSGLAEEGRAALREFRRYRDAAAEAGSES
ncbi:MAG: hypothetical protein V5A15_05085 [Haloarcula sp.]